MQADSAQQQGLYRPEFDHDACGIGALADINGERHHQILDDALVRFDDTRMQAALAILEDMAKARQVILFTCQQREGNAANA